MVKEHGYGKNKETIYKKEEIKCTNIIKQYKKMISYDHFTKENVKEGYPNWPEILDHP